MNIFKKIITIILWGEEGGGDRITELKFYELSLNLDIKVNCSAFVFTVS